METIGLGTRLLSSAILDDPEGLVRGLRVLLEQLPGVVVHFFANLFLQEILPQTIYQSEGCFS